MSTEIVKEQIQRFLETDEPEIFSIKGDWGVGKTFMWNKFLESNKYSLSLDKYSYVSLFGLNSLSELKYAIFENSIKKGSIGLKPSIESLKENFSSTFDSSWKQYLPTIGKLPLLKGAGGAIESISFLSVKKTLICIDDLERRGVGPPVSG